MDMDACREHLQWDRNRGYLFLTELFFFSVFNIVVELPRYKPVADILAFAFCLYEPANSNYATKNTELSQYYINRKTCNAHVFLFAFCCYCLQSRC